MHWELYGQLRLSKNSKNQCRYLKEKGKKISKGYKERDKNRVKVASKTFCCRFLRTIFIERNLN